MSVEKEVKRVVAKHVGLKPDQVMLDDTFEKIDVDSLDAFEICLELEEDLECEIDQDSIDDFNKVSDIVQYIIEQRRSE